LMCPILSSVWPVTVALAKVKVKRRRDSRLATPEASQCWTVNHAAGLCCRLLRLAAAFDVGFVFFHSSIFLPFLSALFVTFSFRTSPSSNVSPLAHERESSSVGMSSEVEETRKTNFALRCDAREGESGGESYTTRGRGRERGRYKDCLCAAGSTSCSARVEKGVFCVAVFEGNGQVNFGKGNDDGRREDTHVRPASRKLVRFGFMYSSRFLLMSVGRNCQYVDFNE
jgi:hypothetical protein